MRAAFRWAALVCALVCSSVAWADSVAAPIGVSSALPQLVGARYELAQTAIGVGSGHFVVGRWDGSLQLWRFQTGAPQLVDVALLPSGEGVQAMAQLSDGRLACSHDAGSLSLWALRGDRIERQSLVEYPPSLGTATSATEIQVGDARGLAVGHESGFLSVWRTTRWGLSLVTTLDVRSSQPVPSPYPLRHIRGLVQTANGQLVSGSEDGDLVLVKLGPSLDALTPQVLTRIRFSPTARRGINGLALSGDWLAVTSCAVGSGDSNLHIFRVLPGRLQPVQALLLKSDAKREQVFSFVAKWSTDQKLWVTTQEGLLWQLGFARPGMSPLQIEGKLSVANQVGTALVYDQERKLLVAVGHEATVLKVP